MTAASEALLRAQVSDLLEKAPHAEVIALGADAHWDGPDILEVHGTNVRVVACRSPLAIHAAIRDFDADRASAGDSQRGAPPEPEDATQAGCGPLVIITDLGDDGVGADVRARILKHRVIPLNRWQAVLAAFSATRLDPRLAGNQDLADALIDLAPAGGYAPSPSGFLDRDTAARALVAALFGASVPDGALSDLIVALADPVTVGRVETAPPAALSEAFAWLRARLGPPTDLVAAAVQAGHARDVPALCLVAAVAWSPAAAAEAPAEAAAIAVRLEPYLGAGVDPSAARGFADAGRALTASQSVPFDAVAEEAEGLLAALRADSLAWASSLLPAGFEQRLVRLGKAITAILDGPAAAPDRLARLDMLAQSVAAHRHAETQPGRAEAATMAARLCRRLALRSSHPFTASDQAGFGGLASAYASEASFADWALEVIGAGEDDPAVAEAYARLAARTLADRRHQDQQFATELARWAPGASSAGSLVLLEDVLQTVVKPLVESGESVLLVVVDGMSMRVHHELLQDLVDTGWAELGRSPRAERLVGVAAFPTVTSVSRTSLLCGTLTFGDSATEKAGFAAACGGRAVAWHKPDLQAVEGFSLAPEVAKTLDARRGPKAVAVVINSVDDHLLKGDQIRVRWRADALGPLRAILRAAEGRIVVLTADHGHVTSATTARAAEGGGERWRPLRSGPPSDDELVLRGPRVLLGEGSIVVPWVDDIRYSSGARHGYHGGASPKEVIVPVTVLTREARDVEGWVHIPAERPPWWDATPAGPVADGGREAPLVRPGRKRPKAVPPAGDQLFPTETAPGGATPAPAKDDWITALQATGTYQAQVRAAGRRAPAPDWVRKALTVLVDRGGNLPLNALAQATGTSALRARGQVSGLAELLNVEGYLVVRVDEAAPGGTVILDSALLAAQFGVSVP